MSSDNIYPSSSVVQGQNGDTVAPSSSSHRRPKIGSGVSVLKNASNTRIKNSSVIVNNVQAPGGNIAVTAGTLDPLKKLYDQVAINAILNGGGRADEVKCYPGTREELIRLIEQWMDSDGQDGAAPSMMWLSGPAGAGKSAIVQTIAERCKERRVQAASFFFFRADPTRSTARPLVATLLYQIFKFCPPVRQAVATILSDDPLMIDASIHDQFSDILSSPLQDFRPPPKPPARRPIVLLIDGLDECDSENKTPQRQILQALDHLLMQSESPFLVLVASRAEPHITMAFKQLSCPVQSIFLDDQYAPEKDIRVFVTGEFSKIKKSHHLAHTLSDDWPSDEDTESIVKKSSGQFIFAATVMRYLANSVASPKLSLERVKGIAPVASNSPFAHLDAIYTYIFSQTDDREAAVDLLSTRLLISSLGVDLSVQQLQLETILCTYNARYTPETLDSCVADLAAILKFNGKDLHFFHASLSDFLQDKSRAGVFYINLDVFAAKILPSIWTKAPESSNFGLLGIKIFIRLKVPTPDITNAFRTISPMSAILPLSTRLLSMTDGLFETIHKLYYPHDVESYREILSQWVLWFVTSKPHDFLRAESRLLTSIDLPRLPYMSYYFWMYKMRYWPLGY